VSALGEKGLRGNKSGRIMRKEGKLRKLDGGKEISDFSRGRRGLERERRWEGSQYSKKKIGKWKHSSRRGEEKGLVGAQIIKERGWGSEWTKKENTRKPIHDAGEEKGGD